MGKKRASNDWENMPTNVTSEGLVPRQHIADLPAELPSLLVLSGGSKGSRFIITGEVTIGRSSKDDFQVPALDVSRRHARIMVMGTQKYAIEDLGSRNGTQVNDIFVQQQVLRAGDKIQIGSETIFMFTQSSPLLDKYLETRKQESVSRLAGGIAHDFNNLMASLLADIRFLHSTLDISTTGDADGINDCLENMERAAIRSVELTNQLLAFAREGKYESRVISVRRLVDQLMTFMASAFGADIDVQTDISGELFVQGDQTQLHQVLINLSLNARDAMPAGGRVSICGERVDLSAEEVANMPPLSPGPHVRLTFRDSGAGMDPETLGKAFDPYFTTKEVGAGSGLGLAAVYGIIRNHGGHVQIESAPGEGATILIHLAWNEGDAAERGRRPSTTSAAVVGGPVLLADDDPSFRRVVARHLTDLGFTVHEAADGKEAMLCFAEHQDEMRFVILDLIMPKLSGKEVLRLMRQINPDVRVVLTSGYVEENRIRDLLQDGAVGFLKKPFEEKTLRQAIERALSD